MDNKYLGVTIKAFVFASQLKGCPEMLKQTFYFSLIRSFMEYSATCLGPIPKLSTTVIRLTGCSDKLQGSSKVGIQDTLVFLKCLMSWDGYLFLKSNETQLWSPHLLKSIYLIEKVQRSFTKHITGIKNKPYDERLKLLNLYSVQRRRDRYQIIYLWKIIEGLVPNLSTPITCTYSERRGRSCVVSHVNMVLCINL